MLREIFSFPPTQALHSFTMRLISHIQVILCLALFALANNSLLVNDTNTIANKNPKAAIFTSPLVNEFKTREQLLDSPFWGHLIHRKHHLKIRSTVIFIEDEDTFLIFDEKDQEKKTLFWIPWSNREVDQLYFTEVDFGPEVWWVGSDNFPLLTISAEYSSGYVEVEREIIHGYSVRVNPSLESLLGFLFTGGKIALESTNSLYIAEKEGLICRANPGGRVQLQVSSKMLSFPAARSRAVEYGIKSGDFTATTWNTVSSSINGESQDGILVYLPSSLVLARCVTKEEYFETENKRQLLEYRYDFNHDFEF